MQFILDHLGARIRLGAAFLVLATLMAFAYLLLADGLSPWGFLLLGVCLSLSVGGVFLLMTRPRASPSFTQSDKSMGVYDSLTGLPNRTLLVDRLQHGLQKAKRENHGLAAMSIELQRMPSLKEEYGSPMGDLLLQEVAKRLKDCLRGTDTVARLEDNRFAVLLENLEGPQSAASVAANLVSVISLPQEINGKTVQISASIGISFYPADSDSADDLIKYADAALYAAKLEGEGAFRFFHLAMTQQANRCLRQERELRQAVESGQMELYYQPRVDMESGLPRGAEALLRWRHPEQGLLEPLAFIPLAEQAGVIGQLGDWVLAQACRQLAAWQRKGVTDSLAINVSGRQLQQVDLPERLFNYAQEFGVPPGSLQIELPERLLLEEPEKYLDVLERLRALGVRVAVDDFGTGYSNLARLRRLPVDLLNIDGSLVRDVARGEAGAQVIHAIVALARSLGLGLVAKGVEGEVQAGLLKAAGCPIAQGYLFSRPQPADVAELWLATRALSRG